MKNDLGTVGGELAKTVAGFIGGRILVVQGANVLKIDEETDDKKIKMKKMLVGAGVAATGFVGALKLPDQYKSIAAGVASAGAIAIISPYGKPNKGFIPVLNGTVGASALEPVYTQEDFEAENELNAAMSFENEPEYQEPTIISSELN